MRDCYRLANNSHQLRWLKLYTLMVDYFFKRGSWGITLWLQPMYLQWIDVCEDESKRVLCAEESSDFNNRPNIKPCYILFWLHNLSFFFFYYPVYTGPESLSVMRGITFLFASRWRPSSIWACIYSLCTSLTIRL